MSRQSSPRANLRRMESGTYSRHTPNRTLNRSVEATDHDSRVCVVISLSIFGPRIANSSSSRSIIVVPGKESRSPTRFRSYSLPGYQDMTATICEVMVETLAGSTFGAAGQQAGMVESCAVGGRMLAEGTELEAAMLWCVRKEELASLVICVMSIAAKEARKRRADDQQPENLALVLDERRFWPEPDRTPTTSQQLAAVQKAADKDVEGHYTILRQCALTLKGKRGAYHSFDCSV